MSTPEVLQLSPSPGPDVAPAAAAGAGLLTDEPLVADWSAGAALRARRPLAQLASVGSDGLELRYAVLPAFDAQAEVTADGFRASAIAVDVLFDDGSRLLDAPVRDQHGLPADAAATFARHVLPPDQWALRRIPLPPGRRAVALEVVVDAPAPRGTTGGRLRAWIDGAALVPARPLDRTLPPSEIADTRRGSHSSPWLSRGLTVPLVGAPHGALFVHPLTDAAHPHWNYSWNAHGGRRPALQGLALSHTASIWIGDWGVLQVMPRLESADDAPVAPTARATGFDHDLEEAHPHRYRVVLDDGIVAEATATDHVAVLRFDFPTPGGSLVLDRLGDGILSFTADDEGGVLHGWIDGSTVHGQVVPRMYVDARVDGPVVALLPAPGALGVLRLDPSAGATVTRTVELRIGTSFISRDLARRSREREASAPFAELRAGTGARWDALLDLVEVEGATDAHLVTLTSSLARLFSYPNRIDERDADGRTVHVDVARVEPAEHGDEHTGADVLPGALSTNHGFWDTYRTAWPALGLLTPGDARTLLDGFVAQFRDGGWLPRWAAPGPLDAMVGTSADIVLADALALGILDDELRRDAYLAVLRDASAVPPHRALGRAGMPTALYRGFVADEVTEGMSWGLESALNDFGAFRLADALVADDPTGPRGDRAAERRWFASRALAAERYFDRETGFFRGLTATGGRRADFDPRVWGGDYTETNAWGMAFSVPHNGADLAALYGGRDGLRRKLDAFFAEPETGLERFRGEYPAVIHEMTEARNVRLGMWGPSNQPAHHIPYLYLHAGDPASTQRIVRDAIDRLFTGAEIGQGYPGDEDNGEMSAWWLFGALGLYPLAPGSGEWVIGSPLFDRMRWRLPGGDLEVIAHRSSRDHPYVQSVLLDGVPWSRTAIPHSRLAHGARLDVALGPEPSEWGTAPEDAPGSLSVELVARGMPPLHDALVAATGTPAAAALVDDLGLSAVDLPTGTVVELALDGAHSIELVTLGAVDAGRASWRIEAATPDGWMLLDERHDEEFRWPGQTRPFLPPSALIADRLRLTALTTLRLMQVEALVG